MLLAPTIPATVSGIITSITAAFVIVWLLDRTRIELTGSFKFARLLPLLSLQVAVLAVLYGYSRRHWLKYLRVQAVRTASELAKNIYAFESLMVATLRQVQEVELVAKGYRLFVPLPFNVLRY